MPKMNGWDATRNIRQRELLCGSHTRIVGLTAHVLDEARNACLAAGMDSVLVKPFEPAQLYAALQATAQTGDTVTCPAG